MRLLIDTQVFLWLHANPERVGRHRDVLADARNDLLVSAASAWEIAIKWGLGRLVLPEPPRTWVPSRIAALDAEALSLTHRQVLAVADLPAVHRDPFDRALVAQARDVRATLVSADPVFARYDVELLVVDSA